jgi:hypothetical protein
VRKEFRRWMRGTLLLLSAIAAIFLGQPIYLWVNAWFHDRPVVEHLPPGYADDESRMNRTRIAEVWSIPAESAAAESQLRDLLRRARVDRLSVAIAGARHSMGGHTIFPDGIQLTMLPFNHMELNAEGRKLRVGAGALWSEIIPYLNSRGLSVAVMRLTQPSNVVGVIIFHIASTPPEVSLTRPTRVRVHGSSASATMIPMKS